MLKILSYNLLIISFVLVSCAKKEESSTTTSSTTYATSKSGVTASGSITVGSDTVSGTYATVCIDASSVSAKPSDSTHIGYIVVITGSSTFTEELNYYTDSACTSLSLGWYDNYTSVVVGDASGSDYKVTYTQANYTFFAKTTAGETYIESKFAGLDVTVGTESVITLGIPFYNLIKVSGTNFYIGIKSVAAYPSEVMSMAYVKQ